MYRLRRRRVAAVLPGERVGNLHRRGADQAPVKLEIDGARAGVLKAFGKLSIGHECPPANADLRSGAMNGEVDSLGGRIGRLNVELGPSAIVRELRRIRPEVPVVE